jgi:hypothetical protein
MRLDKILESYRKFKEEAKEKKDKLDILIGKFLLKWYQWIRQLNLEKLESN